MTRSKPFKSLSIAVVAVALFVAAAATRATAQQQPNRGVSNDHTETLDAVAGSESVDNRIRL